MIKYTRLRIFSFICLFSIVITANSQSDIYAQMGYENGSDGVVLLTHKCQADSSGELRAAVARKDGRVFEGCYVINNRKNPVIKWSTGRVEEIEIKNFSKRTQIVETGPDVVVVSSECKSIYQARVFNYFVENICNFKGKVSLKLGVAAKTICGNEMNESARKSLSDEVKKAIETDIEKMGQSKFCQDNKKGYLDLDK